jgi:tRNA1(Val) A37 N6-methylase TrmN6/nucleoside 2-deoxyribosyltransferase
VRSGTFPLTIFAGGPFSAGLKPSTGVGDFSFDAALKSNLSKLHLTIEGLGAKLLSAHQAEAFGLNSSDAIKNSLVERDNYWLRQCDAYIAMLPLDENRDPWRTDGTFVEIGLAIGLGKPVILIVEDRYSDKWSFYVRDLDSENSVSILSMDEFLESPEMALVLALREYGLHIDRGFTDSEITNPSELIERCRGFEDPYEIDVAGLSISVWPNVFSPKYSRSSDFLISGWCIPINAKVLDMGCGTGILGLRAAIDGASHVTAVDINPNAIQNTLENIEKLGLHDKVEVVLSDVYTNVTGRYDVIICNPPYWSRKAADILERSCFDENYTFLKEFIGKARDFARPNAMLYLVFSDQGDVSLVNKLLQENGWFIDNQLLMRPSMPGGHIRVVWHARLGG